VAYELGEGNNGAGPDVAVIYSQAEKQLWIHRRGRCGSGMSDSGHDKRKENEHTQPATLFHFGFQFNHYWIEPDGTIGKKEVAKMGA
jgi:hypothetical protein